MKYDVFISCKSEDYKQVREIYEFLVNNGLKVFLADAELRKLGNAQYGKVIDAALDSAKHLIVFATKPEYVRSEYVENEWRMFLEEKRSGRKTGNLMSIIQFPIGELPISLRTTQSFPFIKFKDILSFLPIESKTEASESTAMESEESLNAIFKHSKDNNSDQPSKNDKSHDNNKNVFGKVVKRPPLHNKWLICTIIIIFFIVYIIYNQNFNKPDLPQPSKDTIPETKHLILDTLHLNDSISQIEDSISLKEFSIADIENQIIDTMYQKDIKKQVPENFILIPSGTLYKFRDKYDNEFHQYI